MRNTPLIKLCVAANTVDAHMLKSLLEQEGIEAIIRGDGFVPLQGGHLLKMETRPSVWVLDDERRPRAEELVAGFRQGAAAFDDDGGASDWRCRCGETIEGQFTECWSCGRDRPSDRT